MTSRSVGSSAAQSSCATRTTATFACLAPRFSVHCPLWTICPRICPRSAVGWSRSRPVFPAGADRQPDGEVGFSGAWRAEEHDVLPRGDEVECRLLASAVRAWVRCDCVGRLGRAVADPQHRGSGHQCADDASAGPSPSYASAGGRSPRASAAARWRSISRTSGSACRCTSRQSSPSRRNSIVTRNDQS
jgi:hypothetical protein